ncbi:MAG TPA: hypothetical protein V6D06_06420, partial [Trichocoleus sp.]
TDGLTHFSRAQMNQRSNADVGGLLAEEVWRARPPSMPGVWGAATQAITSATKRAQQLHGHKIPPERAQTLSSPQRPLRIANPQ